LRIGDELLSDEGTWVRRGAMQRRQLNLADFGRKGRKTQEIPQKRQRKYFCTMRELKNQAISMLS
jgi:hypothetical protein